MNREEHIANMIEDTITAILESEVTYDPDFNMNEVLADISRTAHVALLLEKHKRDKHATQRGYEIAFA